MPTTTYETVAQTTFNGSQSTTTFSGLSPNGYGSYRLIFSGSNNGTIWMRFNNDTSVSYGWRRITASGSAVSTDDPALSSYIELSPASSNTGSVFANLLIIDIFAPSQTSASPPLWKNVLVRQSSRWNGTGYLTLGVGSYNDSDFPITSITFGSVSNFNANSTVALYRLAQ